VTPEKVAVHVPGQLIPLGLLVTVPPLPGATTTCRTGFEAKVAVTELAAAKVTVHGPVPLHPAPLQPVNELPEPASALRVTAVLAGKGALHAPEGQRIPLGLLVTDPGPLTLTVRTGMAANVAVTELAPVNAMAQLAVPLQLPPQPENEEPDPAAAVSVTWVLAAKLALQVDPQLIPEGVLVTVPVPVRDTVSA
jgi:hypothetical protein